MKKARKVAQHYNLLSVLFASNSEPMPTTDRINYLTKMYEALNSLETSDRPNKEDWLLCSDAVNHMETFIEMKVCTDDEGLLQDATHALVKAQRRHLEGFPIRLDGAGIIAVRSLIQDYAECLKLLPHRTVINCHRRTIERMEKILSGKDKTGVQVSL